MDINKSTQLAKEISKKIGTKDYQDIILRILNNIKKDFRVAVIGRRRKR